MDIVFILALVLAASYGVVRGTEHAKAAVSRGWQARKAAWAATTGSNPRAASLGAKTARGLGTIAAGTVLAARGFGEGWRVGWPEGKEKARQRWGGAPKPTEPPPAPRQMPEPLRLVKTRPAERGTDTTKGKTMAIATVTGGEVYTLDQLIAELDKIAEEAAAEMEDASGDAQRAKEDASRVELMVASLESLDLDRDTIAEVSALGDSSAAKQAAAEQRLGAAEIRHAQALTAVKGVRSRHSLMAEAHAATPHAADKSFYAA